jgi:uncharacterized protein YjbI with pentapeptide repeats
MDNCVELIERWSKSPWKEAIEVILDPNCSKAQFKEMLDSLYPNGDAMLNSATFRGPGNFYDFRGLNLANKNVANTDFLRSDLRCSCFIKANLTGTYLMTSRLENVSFSEVTLAKGVRFDGCFASGADFSKAHLIEADFSSAELTNVNFSGAILENCEFGNAKLDNAKFEEAVMRGCKMMGASMSKKEQATAWYKDSTFERSEYIKWVP